MKPSLSQSQAILILGMHRSGTSLLTRICNLMGATLAEDLIPPREDNAKGFFEHHEIVTLNESIFEYFGLTSQDVTSLPALWWEHKAIKALRDEIKSCVSRTYEGSALWGLKDPRIGKLLPLWLPLLSELGVKPSIIIAFRDPAEVAASLQKRDKISIERGILLWLQYNLDIERETRELKRIWIHYPEILQDTKQITSIIQHAIPELENNAWEEITSFIDKNLHHHHAPQLNIALPNAITALYKHMIAISHGNSFDAEYFDELNKMSDIFSIPFQETIISLDPALHAWRSMVDIRGEERASLKAQIALLEKRLNTSQKKPFSLLQKLKSCSGS